MPMGAKPMGALTGGLCVLGQIELAGGFFCGIPFVTFVVEDGGGGVS